MSLLVQQRNGDPAALNNALSILLSQVVGPVALAAAFISSCTIPFQFRRVPLADRASAIDKLVRPMPRWFRLYLLELTGLLNALAVCYLGPVVVVLISLQWTR